MEHIPAKALITITGGTVQLEGSEQFIRESIAQFHLASCSGGKAMILDKGLEHSWNWFSLHANQRLQGVYFFLLAAAFLTAAYVNALNFNLPGVAAGIGALGSAFSICFYMLEARIRELIKKGETSLKITQAALAEATGVPSFKISDSVEKPRHSWTSYSKVFRGLYLCTIIAALTGTIYAVYRHSHSVQAVVKNELFLAFLFRIAVLIVGFSCLYLSGRLARKNEGSKNWLDYVIILVTLLTGVVFLIMNIVKSIR